MNRKFKKFLYLVFSFLLIINFQNKSFADEHLEKIKDARYACNLFYQKALESDNLMVKNFYNDVSGYNFGFNPLWDWNIDKKKWVIKSDGKSIVNGYNYNLNTAKLLKPGTEILKIEGMDAAKVFTDWNAFNDFSKDKDLLKLEIIDEIIPEPVGGAHRDAESIAADIKYSIIKNLRSFENFSRDEVYDHRKAKFLKIGRDQGFSKSSDPDTGLSYKESNIQKIKSHILENKLIYLGIGLVFTAGIVSIIY